MLPWVAIWGLKFNDVIFTVCLAAFNPVLLYFILRRLVALKLSQRSVADNLWLVACFAFGTVHFYTSVAGQVWHTAHVIGVMLSCLYVLAAFEGRHPFWAGLFLGCGFVTRTPLPFTFPFALGEILRCHLAPPPAAPHLSLREWLWGLWPRLAWRPILRKTLLFGLPMVAIALVAFVLNVLRFDNPFEFGHYYLNVRWSERIQRWGLFNYHFLSRNLAVFFTLTPRIMTHHPYVKISWHGLSLFLTTPIFAYLIWPKGRSPLQPWLYLSVLFPLILHLFYQNSGWVQFGYRFSLDYTIFLFMLWAIGKYRLGPWAKILMVLGMVINSFGAVTFGRLWEFYWDGMFPVD
jgi:hypothetical protein